jgi:RimJ/RimL family protein N-acetyltransferase
VTDLVPPAPLLTTARLELWRPRAGDLASLVELMKADETRRFLGPTKPDNRGQFERLLRNAGSWSLFGYGSMMLRRQGEDAIVGVCGVFHSHRGFGQGMDDVPEAGWIIRNDCWRQGYAGEAMGRILEWFDGTHGPRRIAAMIEEGNAASERVAAALGFERYGCQEYEGAQLNLYERLPG